MEAKPRTSFGHSILTWSSVLVVLCGPGLQRHMKFIPNIISSSQGKMVVEFVSCDMYHSMRVV